MDNYTETPLELKHFELTSRPKKEFKGKYIEYTIKGRIRNSKLVECPNCNGRHFVSKGKRKIKLRHIANPGTRINIEVEYTRWKCKDCGKSFKKAIPFQKGRIRITRYMFSTIRNLLTSGTTLKQCSTITGVCRNLVKKIDKDRIKEQAKDMKPTHFSPFICVDEFSLHKNHQYATIVIDYCTGESLFVTQGKTKEQMNEFFCFVGEKFMRHVVAVSMDMNASYASAFRERYPKIKIVYDGFHLIKNYNDMVLTEIRRAEQRRLIEEMDQARSEGDKEKYNELLSEYKMFKGSRYLLLSNKKTLELKDAASCEHNRRLYEKYIKRGLKLPIGKYYLRARSIERLQEVLSSNEKLQTTYYLGEMLKSSLHCTNQEIFDSGFKRWLYIARKTEYEELQRFCELVRRHWPGIRNRVTYPMSNGPLEGTNCLIKNIRRQSYGIRDDEYFFLKIWEATRRNIKDRHVA